MKNKIVLTALFFLLIFSIAYADISVETIIPDRIEPNQPFQITININTNEENLDFTQMVPQNWNIYNIEVIGTEQYTTEQETRNFMGKTRKIYVWSFKNIETEQITISYETTAPEEGEFEIYSLWIAPGTFDSSEKIISVSSTVPWIITVSEPNLRTISMFIILVLLIVGVFLYKLYHKDLKEKLVKPIKEKKIEEKLKAKKETRKKKPSKKSSKKKDFYQKEIKKLEEIEKKFK